MRYFDNKGVGLSGVTLLNTKTDASGIMAAANSCFVVSSTVNAVHSSLPFLTALGEEARRANSSTVAVLLTSSGDLGSLFDLYFVG